MFSPGRSYGNLRRGGHALVMRMFSPGRSYVSSSSDVSEVDSSTASQSSQFSYIRSMA